MGTRRANNEGTIRERKDGRWEVMVTEGINYETGKPNRRSYYAKTKAEAVALPMRKSTVYISKIILTLLQQNLLTGAEYGLKHIKRIISNSRHM